MINLDAFKPSSIAPTETGVCGRGWVGQKGRCRRAVPGKGMAGTKITDTVKKKSAVEAEKVRAEKGIKPKAEANADRKAKIAAMQQQAAELKGGALATRGGNIEKQQQPPQAKSKKKARTLEEEFAHDNPDDAHVDRFVAAYKKRELKKAHVEGTVEAIMNQKRAGKQLNEAQQKKAEAEARKEAKTMTDAQLAAKYGKGQAKALSSTYAYMESSGKEELAKNNAKISEIQANKRMSEASKAKQIAKLKKRNTEVELDIAFGQKKQQEFASSDKSSSSFQGALTSARRMAARGLDTAEDGDLYAVMRHLAKDRSGAQVKQAARSQTRSKTKQQAFIDARARDAIKDHLKGLASGTVEGGGSDLKVLGIEGKPDAQSIKAAYRKAAAKAHPDRGGSASEFQRLNNAYARVKKQYNIDSRKGWINVA